MIQKYVDGFRIIFIKRMTVLFYIADLCHFVDLSIFIALY
jgi:hypothetical protein